MTGGTIGRGRWVHYFGFWNLDEKWAVSLCQKWAGLAEENPGERTCPDCLEVSHMNDDTIGMEWRLEPVTEALLKRRSAGCFLCKWITDDFRRHGKLTGWPTSDTTGDQFPVSGKIAHIKLEKGLKS
jgi:hypothetical protein